MRLPIADYAMLSDCRSGALVSRDGSVDWLCLPRFDAPSVFGRLLDHDAGHWSLRPAGEAVSSRSYLDATMLLQTIWRCDAGTLVALDAMAMGPDERGHDLGVHAPGALLRVLECTRGAVEVELRFAPRPDYGRQVPRLELLDGGLQSNGGPSLLQLSSAVPLTLEGETARARFTMHAGEVLAFALQNRDGAAPGETLLWTQEEIRDRLEDTRLAWTTWSGLHQSYEGPWRALVHHSGRVLQALTYQPTGAIVAALTTSLPETVGGTRNWDYRFTWLRDASLTLEALWVAACPDEAWRFFDFIAESARSQLEEKDHVQIMFGIGGEEDLSECELGHLRGWRESRPVRVGNGAWEQRQLDVYGEVLGAAERLRQQLGELGTGGKRFLARLADAAAANWKQPDQGIWEIRGAPRHFLYSKLMCWVALDRAIALADLLEAGERVPEWTRVREEIRQSILERGFSERAQAFTQCFDSDELDASCLMLPLVGFLPADDPRVLATMKAIAERLTDANGLVYRYLSDDGMEGEEGTFLLCTFWLAQAQALAGQLDEATLTFNRAASFANDVGLLAEEAHPGTGELLGNFPQAFSHIGLVNAAWAITQATKPETSTVTMRFVCGARLVTGKGDMGDEVQERP